MSQKRKSDEVKRQQDMVHELRERGILDVKSVKDVAPLHPGGMTEALKTMLKNSSYTKDQSQEQRERNRR
jgi:hypothetical protein